MSKSITHRSYTIQANFDCLHWTVSQLTETVKVLLSMIWLKVKRIPIPKLVVTIYHQTDYHFSYLRPLKCTVRVFIFLWDNFPIQCQCLFSWLDHSIWHGAFDELLATTTTYFNLNNVINFFVNDTELRGLSQEWRLQYLGLMTKTFLHLFSLGFSSVLESSAETSSMPQWKPLFCSFCLYLFP